MDTGTFVRFRPSGLGLISRDIYSGTHTRLVHWGTAATLGHSLQDPRISECNLSELNNGSSPGHRAPVAKMHVPPCPLPTRQILHNNLPPPTRSDGELPGTDTITWIPALPVAPQQLGWICRSFGLSPSLLLVVLLFFPFV